MYILMSNKIIWELLGSLMLRTLDELGELRTVTEVERQGENHPLVLYVESYFRKFFAPNGGLSCPELGKHIEELRKRNPTELEQIVRVLVKEYCSKTIPGKFRYGLGERRSLREKLTLIYG